jgi:HEAT repeats/von Willebrand factor type A domain
MRRGLFLLLILTTANAGALAQEKPPPLPKEAQDRIKEFQRNSTSQEPRVRAEQMEQLAKVDFPEAVKLLQNQGLKDDEYSVRERAIWALSQMKTDTSRAAVLTGLKEGNELVKAGTVIAIARMQPPPPNAIAEISSLSADAREDIQVAMCEALGITANKEAVPALLNAAKSGRERVGVAAADALMLIKDPSAAPTLIAMLNGGSWRTQVAAINALAALRVKESVWPLIAYLKDSQGRPREDARTALEGITTMDFGMNAPRWEEWWEGVKDRWNVPPLPDKKKGVEVVEKGDRYGRVERGYHHMKITSKKVLFVIDVSASMLDPIRVKRGRNDPEGPTKASPKLDLAREELARTLRTLDENVNFNVIAFESDIRFFKKEAVAGTPGNVQEAIQWVEKQKPRTAGTGGMRQSSGVDSDGLLMGRTNTYGALKATFGLPHRPKKKGEGGTTGPGANAPKPGIDTVYFLTDGEPTEGETTNIDEILQDVKQWNRSARLIINTIGMNAETGALKNFLVGLAQITGGQSVFVGE